MEHTKVTKIDLGLHEADIQALIKRIEQLEIHVKEQEDELKKWQEQAERAFLHIQSRYFPHGLW